jgi:hypothetical protein
MKMKKLRTEQSNRIRTTGQAAPFCCTLSMNLLIGIHSQPSATTQPSGLATVTCKRKWKQESEAGFVSLDIAKMPNREEYEDCKNKIYI